MPEPKGHYQTIVSSAVLDFEVRGKKSRRIRCGGASEANVRSTAPGLLELFANLIRVSIK
jgi:hypothetical protein